MNPVFVWAIAGFLGLGALSMLLMRITGRSDETFLRRYVLQGGLVFCALVPPALGTVPALLSMFLIGTLCAREVATVAGLRAAAVATCSALILGVVAVQLWLTRAAPPAVVLGGLALLSVLLPWLVSGTRLLDSQRALFVFASLWPTCSVVALMTLTIRSQPLVEMGFLYGVLEVSDSAAYIVGKSFGKRKMAPRLSPHKTWEGLLAGCVAAAAAAWAFSFCLPELSPLQRLLLGLFLGLWGVLSDLSVSVFKRARGKKDYGTLLGPHGGLFDAYDSFLITGSLWAFVLSL